MRAKLLRASVALTVDALGPAWVDAWRWRWRRRARALSPAAVGPLVGYFSGESLRLVRVVEVERIDLLAPVGGVVGRRIAGAVGMIGSPAGLALDDLVVLAAVDGGKVDRSSLLFHEMVHVVQWGVLGRRRFL